MRPSLQTQRLIALAVAGAVMLNFPLLTLWDVDATILGLPLLPVALFTSWAVLIACAAWIVRVKVKGEAGGADDDADLADDEPSSG
jgi:hypothetical protein